MGKKRIQKKQAEALVAIPDSVKRAIPSVEVIYFLENIIDAKDKLTYYIVSDPKDENPKNAAYHYKSDLAKELFCSFRKTRSDMAIKHNGKRYLNTKRLYANKKGVPEYIMPNHIVIREGAGYYSNTLPDFCKNVDVLLYFPYTDNYESVRATYNSKADICYMDLRLFARYLKSYGYPDISYDFAYTNEWETESYWDSYYDAILDEDDEEGLPYGGRVRSKSALKLYGYNVSQEEGLSNEERQELLGEIMDLNLISKDEVLQILKSAVRMHSGSKYIDAQTKWTADIKFVKDYKVDSSRVLPKKVAE